MTTGDMPDAKETLGKTGFYARRRVRIMRILRRRAWRRVVGQFRGLQRVLIRGRASWLAFDRARSRVHTWIGRLGEGGALALLVILVGISAFWIPAFQSGLEPVFAPGDRLQALRSLFGTLGGALLGATAIVSSLVLFSMQVNVERMPHGLFRRLSADRRLLGGFSAAFLLAVFVAVLSLIPDTRLIGVTTFGASWATALTLLLFLYGYRRALILINPLRQLGLVVAKTQREFRVWERRAQRAAPFLSDQDAPRRSSTASYSNHDLPRVTYFQLNSGWTNGAKQAVRYAVSFTRRYAEHGDHEVSAAATKAIIAINAAYIRAKGRTFFTNQLMFDNPLTSDGFINDTLEHLRQTARIGISRGDEQQVEQTLYALAALVGVYTTIDYGNPNASKTHAHLAATYLTAEVERIALHNLSDVLMEGARLIGQCANQLLSVEGPDGIGTLVQKLGLVGCFGVAKEDYRAVTLTSVEQLAGLSLGLLRARSGNVRSAARQIRDSITLIAKLFLTLQDTPLSSIHSTFLGPYYSATSAQALASGLAALANAVIEARSDDEGARQVIENFTEWSDGIYAAEKSILLDAVARRSHFTFDMLCWITKVTSILLAIANAPACSDRRRAKLQEHALWLISVLSFIPGDLETVQFIENFQMTEKLFEAAVDARHRNCPEIVTRISELLLSWMFKGGQYHSGWGILEHATYGLAVLALLPEADGAVPRLKDEINRRLAAGGLPDEDVRNHGAREIRGRAETLYRPGHWGSSIEQGIAQTDHARLEPLLRELADMISPATAGQAADIPFF